MSVTKTYPAESATSAVGIVAAALVVLLKVSDPALVALVTLVVAHVPVVVTWLVNRYGPKVKVGG